MASSSQQVRSFTGPAVLSYGFRPFFLSGAAWAVAAMLLWLAMLSGRLALPMAYPPLQWHGHELVLGFVPAIVAGFLLTAVPNWTGRLPITGRPLLALVSIWAAGRAAILLSALIGKPLAALVDLSFLAALVVVVGREIIAGGNRGNIKVLAAVLLLLAANVLYHLEAVAGVGDGHGLRLAVAATVLLIMLIGGRVIPSFTRNWLARQAPGALPAPFAGFDILAMVASGAALASWVALPENVATALLALGAGVLNGARLVRWRGMRTATEPLVLVLHVAYAFVPLGFLLVALAILRPGSIAPTGALHAWTAGAIGLMTLAIMTRASLGHTGRPLTATRPIVVIYLAALVAATTRILAGFGFASWTMLEVSAIAWVAAFGLFVIVFAPLLTRPRP
jgi:uncharacterized protein involved in response to NO